MLPVSWIFLAVLIGPGGCEGSRQNIRHERTRYLSLGTHFMPGSDSEGSGVTRAPRPLFSWDSPTNESSAAPHLNYRSDISAIKPTAWHYGREKSFKRPKAANRSRPEIRPKPVSFRKSYVYNAIPPEEVKPSPSKKIIYVVSRRSGKKNRRKGGYRCKSDGKCGGSKRKHKVGNEIAPRVPPGDVDYFPKGLVAQAVDEQRRFWSEKRNKGIVAEYNGNERIKPSGACSSESCDQICTEENGRVLCSCYSGFRLIKNNRCIDIDECEMDNGGCDGTCVNTIGSRRCLCPEGFRLSPSNDKCLDINECLLRNGHGPCQDTCKNTRGGYYCSCEGLKGTILSRDNHTCEEVNDCLSGTVGCSHSCISTFGRSFCICPDGYELGDDWKTCHDIDECSEIPERCDYGCINTIGSYYCELDNTKKCRRRLRNEMTRMCQYYRIRFLAAVCSGPAALKSNI